MTNDHHATDLLRIRDNAQQARDAYHHRIAQANADGLSTRTIANIIGVSHQTVHNIITAQRSKNTNDNTPTPTPN